MKQMIQNIIIALVTLVSASAFAADSQVTGTITLSGVLAPKAISINFALNDCGAGTTLAACKSTLNSATFAGHANNASLNIGNIVDGETNVRYVQFEAKTKMILLKNDFVQFIAALTSSTNDITVTLHQMNYLAGGRAAFGQTTLGIPGVSDLSAGEAMLNGVNFTLNNVLTSYYDSSVDNPAVVNDKVFFAQANGEEMIVRGVLAVTFGQNATSSAYNAVITAGFIAKDN
jgi:hypothetical protein